MPSKFALLVALALLLALIFCKPLRADDSVYVWFGNIDSAPLMADTGQLLDIDIYIMTTSDAYVGDCLICLGTENRCIDSLLSLELGEFYYPFNEWDTVFFLPPFGSPPNPEGCSSQSFVGYAELYSPFTSPWLHLEEPTLALRMVIKTGSDLSLVGELANCLSEGIDQYGIPSYFADTCGMVYPYQQFFCPVQFAGGGFVAGLVTNTEGEPLANTAIRDMQTQRTTIADENGEYMLGGIYQGSHDIWFDPPFYAETTITSINVTDGQITALDLVTGTVNRVNQDNRLPGDFELKQNYPNPFNAATSIEYLLPVQAHVIIDILDINGRLITRLVDQNKQAGSYQINWNAGDLTSGIYFYRISTGYYINTRKMILLK